MIKTKILPDDQVEKYKTLTAKFIEPNPTQQLNTIYIISNMTEIIGLRAENDWSIENKHIVAEDQRRLGIENPNFKEFIGLINGYAKKPTYGKFKEILAWLEKFLTLIDKKEEYEALELVYIPNYTVDVRHSDSLNDCLNYLINYAQSNLKDNELKKEFPIQ